MAPSAPRSRTLNIRLLVVILSGLLAFGSVLGQQSGARYVSISPDRSTEPSGRHSTNFQLKGVLISNSTRMALVNGEPAREGDRVAGVEIIAIEEGGVRVLIGAQESTVNVGGTIAGDPSASRVARTSRRDANRRHTVKPGETLSEIALRYRRDGVSMNQMMTALFDTNTQAFDDNINALYEGAILRIPDGSELHHRAPETATAEVIRQTDRWQTDHHQPIEVASKPVEKDYGPVKSGETLSGIAASLLHEGVTMNQMMIALFQANQHAFDGNINLLHADAVLRIPDEEALYQHAPELATAEVLRQTKAWQTGYEQHALLTLEHANIIAANDGLID